MLFLGKIPYIMKTKAFFLLAIAGIMSFSCQQPAPKADSLKEAYEGSFKMGCAISPLTFLGFILPPY